MPDLLTAERETYRELWAVDSYAHHSPGADYVPVFLEMSGATAGQSVLDAGCGTGKGAIALQRAGLSVRMCDLTGDGRVPEAMGLPFTDVCLWGHVRRTVGFADYVYCCDVMEHIPTALTMLTASRLLEVSRQAAFFSIALVPDVFGAWVGKPLHQTVQSFTWWRDHLNEVGTVLECRDLWQTGLYLVAPR